MVSLKILLAAGALAATAAAQEVRQAPYIIKPTDGTHVQPGQAFDFRYQATGDYCSSSFNYNVYLITEKPTSVTPGADWANGWFFGRFAEENYPGNPDPTNLPPAQLVMPDFSQSPGGFGQGATASNKSVYLVVLEEHSTCSAAFGNRLGFSKVTLIYNATTS